MHAHRSSEIGLKSVFSSIIDAVVAVDYIR